MPELKDSEFREISALVHDKFGIKLPDQKKILVQGRLQGFLKKNSIKTFSEYIRKVRADKTDHELVELVNRITTNHTYFFRESDHFGFFSKTVLPEITDRQASRGVRDIRVWCAGCSSGEEPYALVMLMMEALGSGYAGWNAGVLATDISAKVLAMAKRGVYERDQVDKVPPPIRAKYFKPSGDGGCEVCPTVKKEVTFRSLNLMNAVFPFKKPFQVIFCRNVMIYFDSPTKLALVRRYAKHLEPGGYLFIGHSESLLHEATEFEYVCPAVYRKKA
ncbi:MAG: chemotaxis protein CheR [Bdellovibrionales bacterium RIFOXYD1_FULL_53_11]|nr:MAG: chemotaxis protein CheR [Bdellovibrionales bacterium RIFOXYD1_FULL_53_11]